MGRRPSISRDVLLDAAETVVLQMGATRMTFEAVAEQAGVSKGGLLYSFPTKEALLQGMVSRLCERFDAARAAVRKQGSTAADDLKAYVVSTFAEDPSARSVAAALLAAVVTDLKLLAPMHEHQQRDMAELSERSPDFGRAAVVWLATAGVWLLELFQSLPLTDGQRQQVMEELLHLADTVATRTVDTSTHRE